MTARAGAWWILAACVPFLFVYHPVLTWGPVAEDFQFALKGARIHEEPIDVLRPLQHVWRPLAVLPFVVMAGLDWQALRATQVGAGLALCVLGFLVMRRLVKLRAAIAAGIVVLWLLSPLSSGVLCGETAFIGHLLFGNAVLVALLALTFQGRGAQVTLVLAVALALLCKEDAIVLPLAVLVVASAVLHQPLRQSFRLAALAAIPILAYLPVYAAVTRFSYRGFYGVDAPELAAKIVATGGSFLHLLPPTSWGFVDHLRTHPWQASLAVLMLASLPAALAWSRQRGALGWLLVAMILLLPTLPSPGQAARWTFLPWLAFLAACSQPFTVVTKPWMRRRLAPLVLGLGSVLMVTDGVLAWGDVRDWGRFEALTRRLEGELGPLRAAARSAHPMVVWRDGDSGPLNELLFNPAGTIKFYFPRPDDPYGIVSLEAMLGWQLHREGLAVRRVPKPPQGAVVLLHREGGFEPAPPWRASATRGPGGSSQPAVNLMPIPWRQYRPDSFP